MGRGRDQCTMPSKSLVPSDKMLASLKMELDGIVETPQVTCNTEAKRIEFTVHDVNVT